MDPVTHGLLGATIGQAFFKEKLGNKAVLWAAPIAMIPDIDIVTRYVVNPFSELTYHRGITHSLWFGPVLGSLLGYSVWKYYQHKASLKKSPPQAKGALSAWMLLFSLSLLSHGLLDFCTSYGTQLLAPFSDKRFAVDAVSVIDPFYTFILLASLIAGFCFKPLKRLSSLYGRIALTLSTVFLMGGSFFNNQAISLATKDLELKNLEAYEVSCYPTLFQPFYRRLVAQNGGTSCIGYISLLRPKAPIAWQCMDELFNPLAEKLKSTREGKLFNWFAMGKVRTVIKHLDHGNTLVQLNDLRYGFPGTPSLWGIEAIFNNKGERISSIEYFSHRPPFELKSVWEFLKRIF
jgi:inner membrane protein